MLSWNPRYTSKNLNQTYNNHKKIIIAIKQEKLFTELSNTFENFMFCV